jgi:heptosyltransferase II
VTLPATPSFIRTLVVAPNWVGDLMMAWPALEALGASDRELVVLARRHLHPLLGLAPRVVEVIEQGEPEETVERLRESACVEAVLLPNSFRSAWLVKQAGIPHRWGYRGNLRSPLLTAPVPRPKDRRHQTEDYRELLAALGAAEPASWPPRLSLPETVRKAGAERLSRGRLDPGGLLVGLFPGAEFGPSKRWPWKRFAELARALRRERPELGMTILAGPREVWLAVRLFEESGKIHPVIGPELDLAQLAGVLSHLDLLVTNDSGPMHLAASLGVPCVALFGPTDPRRTAPAGSGHSVLYTDRWCSPCFRRRCPLLHHRCLRDIGVDAVAEAALAALPPQDQEPAWLGKRV